MERNPDLMPKYYKMLEKGLLPTTSQINEASYYDFFEGLIQNGDVLHITFSSALSGSANNAYRAAAAIKRTIRESSCRSLILSAVQEGMDC